MLLDVSCSFATELASEAAQRASESEDVVLILRVAKRDITAFERLYDKFSPTMFSLALRTVQSRKKAEEIVQEAFMFIWHYADDYQVNLGPLFQWIANLTRSHALKRRPTHLRSGSRANDTSSYGECSSFDSGGKISLFVTKRGPRVLRALATLSEVERQAIELSYFDGSSPRKIANKLHVPLATARTLLSQGLFKLRRELIVKSVPVQIDSVATNASIKFDSTTPSQTDFVTVQSTWRTASDCVKVLSLEGRLEWVNEPGLRMMELENFSEIEGTSWFDFWKDEPTRNTATATVALAGNGQSSHFSGFCATGRGTPKWWDVVVSPILESDGKIGHILSVSRDITVAATSI